MFSRCRNSPVTAALLLLLMAAALASCDRQKREYGHVPAAESGPDAITVSKLMPGGKPPPPVDPRVKLYEGNAFQIAEGKRYFAWYNCNGCHANGGGGMGPALIDNEWRYGGRVDQIYASILEGRPNGMPTWRGTIPDAQIWQIAAYVRSLSTPSAAQGGAVAPAPTPPPPVANPPAPKDEAPGVQSTPK